MADLVVTPLNVVVSQGSTLSGIAGQTIAAGQLVYLDSVSGNYFLAQANALATAEAAGVALNNAGAGQPLSILTQGIYNSGAVTAKGQVYMVSAANAGGIAPVTDIVSGNYVTFVGIAIDTANIRFNPIRTGITHA